MSQDVNLELTRAARHIADEMGLPLGRSVRYTDGTKHDVVVPRDSRRIYLSSGLPTDKAIAALERAVRQAARIDYDVLSDDDRRRIINSLEDQVSQLSYQVVKATKERDWDEAYTRSAQLEGAIQRLQGFTEEAT